MFSNDMKCVSKVLKIKIARRKLFMTKLQYILYCCIEKLYLLIYNCSISNLIKMYSIDYCIWKISYLHTKNYH